MPLPKRWTGAGASWVSLKLMSSEKANPVAPTVSGIPEGNTAACAMASASRHCGVEDPMHALKLHAREPRDPVAIRSRRTADRWEKAMSYKTDMHGGRESSGGIVLAKRSNEGLGGPQGIVEGRLLAEENVNQSIPPPDSVPDEWANHGWVVCARRPMLRSADPRWEPRPLGARARFCAGGGQQ